MKLSVCSVILPELTFGEQVSLLRELHYDAIEIRVRDRTGEYVDSIGPANVRAELPRLKAALRPAGLPVCALGGYVNLHDPDLPALETTCAAAAELGAPMVRVMPPDWDGTGRFEDLFAAGRRGLDAVVRVVRGFGIKAVLELHMHTIVPSASAARRMLEGRDPADIGVILDPGNMVHEGFERWEMAVQILGPYLAHVHAKNAAWRRSPGDPARWESGPAAFAEGCADWPAIVQALAVEGYDGCLSVEDFTRRPAREKLTAARDFLRPLLDAAANPAGVVR